MKKKSTPVRGTRDILPLEMELRDYLQNKVLDIYRTHGFERIETPALENLDLLLNSDGGENVKMLFTILKRGNKLRLQEDSSIKDICDIGLRYDLTLPLSRFYTNNKETLQYPFKSIQIDNVYRAERPQKGRFRSFKQCDIDIIGEENESAEIELIDTTTKALTEIGLKEFVVRINDRRILSSIIIAAGFKEEHISSVSITLDKLDKIGEDGVVIELISKDYEKEKVDRLIDNINSVNEENLSSVVNNDKIVQEMLNVINSIRILSNGAYKIEFDPTLVRGMGYYTGQIFEISYGPYGFSIAGGGRYDNMIENISNKQIPAVGFSIGFERIITILKEEGRQYITNKHKIALLYNKEDNITEVIKKADEFRENNYSVTLIYAKKKLSKQIDNLKENNYDYFLVFGKNEDVKEIK